jgi:adenosylcobinamide-phosphate synthase
VPSALIAVLVAQRSLHDHVAAVARALDAGGWQPVAQRVRRIVGRDPMSPRQAWRARAAIESLAENFSFDVVAPVFWSSAARASRPLRYKMANTWTA